MLARQPTSGTPLTAVSTAVSAELTTVDEAIRTALEAAGRAAEWSPNARADALARVAAWQDRLSLLRARILTAERGAGTWGAAGDRDLTGFAGRVSHRGRGEGAAQVAQATVLTDLPRVAAALVDGPVTIRHVGELARAGAASPALAARLATPEGQAEAVRLAADLDGARFGKRLSQWAAALDPVSVQRSHDEQRSRRFLELSATPGGTWVRGQLDNVAGYKLAKLLDAVTARPGVDDERDAGQRRADALAAVVERALSDQATGSTPVAPVQALITFSEATWAGLRAGRGGRVGRSATGTAATTGAGSAADLAAALRGADPVLDENGTPWPASEIGRALCGCALTGAVIDAQGQPLHLGRTSRLFTRAHWLALYASGQRTCAVEGCTTALRHTELHRFSWWDRNGGSTDPENLAPECSYHHHEIHRLDLRVTRRRDGTYQHCHPDGRPYGAPRPVRDQLDMLSAPPPVPDQRDGLKTPPPVADQRDGLRSGVSRC